MMETWEKRKLNIIYIDILYVSTIVKRLDMQKYAELLHFNVSCVFFQHLARR